MATDPHPAPRQSAVTGSRGRVADVAGYAALTWLLALTALNLATHGSLRTTALFAVPVCIVAWHRWRAGFVLAALAIVCAWVGGAMPEPGSTEPLWADALVAFAKLSVDALVAHTWGRRMRAKARARDLKEDGSRVD